MVFPPEFNHLLYFDFRSKMLKSSKFRFRKSIFPADLKDRSYQVRLMKLARFIFRFANKFRKVDPTFNEMALSDKLFQLLPEPNLKTSKCNRTLTKFQDMNIYKFTPKHNHFEKKPQECKRTLASEF